MGYFRACNTRKLVLHPIATQMMMSSTYIHIEWSWPHMYVRIALTSSNRDPFRTLNLIPLMAHECQPPADWMNADQA